MGDGCTCSGMEGGAGGSPTPAPASLLSLRSWNQRLIPASGLTPLLSNEMPFLENIPSLVLLSGSTFSMVSFYLSSPSPSPNANKRGALGKETNLSSLPSPLDLWPADMLVL